MFTIVINEDTYVLCRWFDISRSKGFFIGWNYLISFFHALQRMTNGSNKMTYWFRCCMCVKDNAVKFTTRIRTSKCKRTRRKFNSDTDFLIDLKKKLRPRCHDIKTCECTYKSNYFILCAGVIMYHT